MSKRVEISSIIKNNQRIISIAFIELVILAFSVCNCLLHGLGYLKAIDFFFTQLLLFYIPGLAISEYLIKNKVFALYRVLFSYIFGITVSTFLYIICMTLNTKHLFLYFEIVVIIFSVTIILKKNCRKGDVSSFFDWSVVSVFICVLGVISTYSVGLMNSFPNQEHGSGYYIDYLYWVGNNIEISNNFPPDNFRLVGEKLKYHYFSSIVVAIESCLPNMDVREVSFFLQYILVAVLISLAVYCLLKKFTDQKILLFLGMIVVLLTEGESITYVWHMYFCPFGYDYGVVFGIAAFLWLSKLEEIGYEDRISVAISMVLIMMMTGMKGPIALIVMASFGVSSIRLILKKDTVKKGVVLGLLWGASFLLIYLLFIKGNIATGEKGLHYVGLVGGYYNNPWAVQLHDLIVQFDVNDNIAKVLAVLMYVLRVNVCSAFFAIVAGIYLVKIKGKEYAIMTPLIMAIFGTVMTLVTHQSGSSEMYFVMATIPYATLAGIISIDRIRTSHKKTIILLLFIPFLIRGSRIFWANYMIPRINESVIVYRDGAENKYNFFSISSDEYSICKWIDDNLPNESIIALDNKITKEELRGMCFGVFSSDYIWNDGSVLSDPVETDRRQDIVNKVIEGQFGTDVLIDEGVNYLVLNRETASNGELQSIVYENDSMVVYKLNNDN